MTDEHDLAHLDRVDPGLADRIRQVRANPVSNRELGAVALRAWPGIPVAVTQTDILEVRDTVTDSGVRLRSYRDGTDPAPGVLYLHGGGWVLGDLDSHDASCRRLARDLGATVIAVDYARTPEFRIPDSVADARDALAWVDEHRGELGIAAEVPLAAAGDSAGAHLALLLAQGVAGTEHELGALLLWYPVTDLAADTASMVESADGWGLTADNMRWFIEESIPAGVDPRSGALSPLYGDLGALPPTVVVTAGHDVLRDEALALVSGIAAAGGRVQLRHEPDLIHGFLSLHAISVTARATEAAAIADFRAVLPR